MGQYERARLQQQARVIRQLGQPLFLLIAHEETKPAANLLEGIVSQRPPSPASDTRVPFYGIVRYHKQSELKFDEAGRMTFRHATVELIAMYEVNQSNTISKAYAVELHDKSVMLIESRELAEGGETYTLETSGWIRVAP
jgi:hypothetical protein